MSELTTCCGAEVVVQTDDNLREYPTCERCYRVVTNVEHKLSNAAAIDGKHLELLRDHVTTVPSLEHLGKSHIYSGLCLHPIAYCVT